MDIAYVGPLLQIAAVGFLFTMFAVAGFTHALNLFDGLNGFSSFIAITIMVAFGYLAFQYGHADLFAMTIFVAVAFLGFMVFNFPKGRIFLGDVGAYCFGFVIAWNAVLFLHREPDISAWAILSNLFWPVADTLWAMLRRLLNNMPVGKPDRLHFHSVMQRTLIIWSRNRMNLERANPIASLLLWPAVVVPVLMGVLLVDFDPQGNASTGLGVDPQAREMNSYRLVTGECSATNAIVTTEVPGLSLITATMDLSAAEV